MNGWLIDFLRENPEIKEVSIQRWSQRDSESAPLMISIGIKDSDTGWLRFYRKIVDLEAFTNDDKLLDLLNEMLEENKNYYAIDRPLMDKIQEKAGYYIRVEDDQNG